MSTALLSVEEGYEEWRDLCSWVMDLLRGSKQIEKLRWHCDNEVWDRSISMSIIVTVGAAVLCRLNSAELRLRGMSGLSIKFPRLKPVNKPPFLPLAMDTGHSAWLRR